MNHLSIALFHHLNECGVRYAVLRNYRSLPEDLGGSDLDIWIHSEDAPSIPDLLRCVAEEENAKLVSYIPDPHCAKWCLLSPHNGIQIDAFAGGIFCRGAEMFSEKVLAQNVRDYGCIHVLDDACADVIAFWKETVNNGRCGKKYLEPVSERAQQYTPDYLREQLPFFSKKTRDLFAASVQGGTSDIPVGKLCRMARADLHVKSGLFRRLSKLGRLFRRPGYVIAVLGTDGSGKSTIINAITPWLDEAFHNKVKYSHLRPALLPDLGVLLGKKKASEVGETPMVVSAPHAGKTAGPVGSLIRWCYYLPDYWLGFWRKVWPLVATCSAVQIFDRYYYDYYIDQRRFGIHLPHWLLRLGGCLVPTPDVILCLGGNPEDIYARKPETSLGEVTRQTDALKHFCRRQKHAVWVDTTTSQEESIAAAKAAVLKAMSTRFSQVL